MQTATRVQNVSILHTFDVKKNTKRLQKNIKLIWLGRAPGAQPLEQGKSGRTNVFVIYFTQNVCHRLHGAISHHPSSSCNCHGFPRRSGAAPSTVNTGPRAHIFEYVGHQHVPQAWRPHIGAAQARYGFYCHRNAWYVKIRSKNHGGILPSIMAAARLGALLCAQYRPTSAHIRVCWPRTCVPRLCGGGN